LITLPEQRSRLERLDATHPDVHWDRLLFSAKESVWTASTGGGGSVTGWW
jgi:4'-phosphopantetheinyl transferase EntD